ncbi:MAG: hypothetical protein U0559_04585 [Anaerolineae bacterium]
MSVALAPIVKASLQRHAEQSLPWNAEEMQSIKRLIDAVHNAIVARKNAEREQARAALATAVPLEKPIGPAPADGNRSRTSGIDYAVSRPHPNRGVRYTRQRSGYCCCVPTRRISSALA